MCLTAHTRRSIRDHVGVGRPAFVGARKGTMSRVYGVAIWIAIAIIVTGLSMLFGFWGVLAVGGGIAAAGALLHRHRV